MKRRNLLAYGLASSVLQSPFEALAADKWGADHGYPTGWGGQFSIVPEYRVGNYSGGYEKMFPYLTIKGAQNPSKLSEALLQNFRYQWNFSYKRPEEYLDTWPTTGLLICRDSNILCEHYRHARSAQMRFTSWSMAKSITSLLLGLCIENRLIDSYEDIAEKYVSDLKGTLHGSITLRNLSNMSSGAEVIHDRDNRVIYPSAFSTKFSSISRTVSNWNQRREDQGMNFNYNELCPLTLGMVIRSVTGSSLSAFAQQNLWIPMGAEGDATWTTDSQGKEFNCIGFAATLRDWARVGTLIANRGSAGNKQIISESWISEFTSWGDRDKQVRFGASARRFGYKAHMWHSRPDGSRLYFNGHHGQRVIVDMPTRTVLVHTAVDGDGNWEAELFAMFDAATKV